MTIRDQLFGVAHSPVIPENLSQVSDLAARVLPTETSHILVYIHIYLSEKT